MKRGTWFWAAAGLALLGLSCAGPGLEPPQDQGLAGSGSGTGGAGGAAGTGGGAAGMGSPIGGGTGGEPIDNPGTMDASTNEPSTDADGGVDGSLNDDAGATYDSRELVGPSYMGSVSNGAECSMSYPTQGHEPVSAPGAKHPLFLYFVGTEFVPGDASAQHDSPAALAVTEAMARRGFVALSVSYDNDAIAWLSDHVSQLACLFDASKPASAIAAACALPNVDCELGVATWGHSQGAYVAHMAHNNEPRVRAAWTTGYGGDGMATLSSDRLRVVNGEADAGDNGTAAKLMMITGMTAAECGDPDQCLRDDGSGWIIVRKSELAAPDVSSADHCWFDRQSCSASAIMLEPNWVSPASDKAFALEANADWVASTTRR